MATIYDEVPYPSAVYPQTHPDGLAAMAILSGMKPAPVERCRVLELGCGDGFNLLSMAYGLPESEFVGIDLAAAPVARGTAIAEKLGLKNISLLARDVTEAGPELGEFDYIIAHGLYSWVPAPVREKIMELCQKQLSAQGVAYISYNAYPGNHTRDIVRGMMRYHVAQFTNPTTQIGQARGLVKMLAEAGNPNEPFQQLLVREFERITKYTDAGFFHDDLSACNQPFYFHEFMSQAQRHGLQFLGEADIADKREIEFPPDVKSALDQLDPRDVIGYEQYRDFLRCRSFRSTLLCHQGIPLNRGLSPEYMGGLFLAGQIKSAAEATDPRSNLPELFTGPKKSEFETDRPVVKAAFRRIGAAWPAFIHFPDLLAQVRSDLGRTPDEESEADVANLAAAMLQAAIAGGVELRAHRPRFLLVPGERPMASALARIQIEGGKRVSTMMHQTVQIDDDLSRLLLKFLDGSRDRRALCEELQKAVRQGQVNVPAAAAERITESELEQVLERLARLGLLLA